MLFVRCFEKTVDILAGLYKCHYCVFSEDKLFRLLSYMTCMLPRGKSLEEMVVDVPVAHNSRNGLFENVNTRCFAHHQYFAIDYLLFAALPAPTVVVLCQGTYLMYVPLTTPRGDGFPIILKIVVRECVGLCMLLKGTMVVTETGFSAVSWSVIFDFRGQKLDSMKPFGSNRAGIDGPQSGSWAARISVGCTVYVQVFFTFASQHIFPHGFESVGVLFRRRGEVMLNHVVARSRQSADITISSRIGEGGYGTRSTPGHRIAKNAGECACGV